MLFSVGTSKKYSPYLELVSKARPKPVSVVKASNLEPSFNSFPNILVLSGFWGTSIVVVVLFGGYWDVLVSPDLE